MIRPLIVTSLASLVILLPSVGKVTNEPVAIYKPNPPKEATLKDTPLKPVEAIEAVYTAPAVTYTPPVTNCGSDPNMAFIYQHESGCRTNAINPIGACGLGQALPCSKMGCSLSDWACQNNFFIGYALARYGSTYNAYLFWLQNHWW